jgi:hypothetical protein
MDPEKDRLTVCGLAEVSVTSSVKAYAPLAVGVPVIAPVLASKVRPLGIDPELAVQV